MWHLTEGPVHVTDATNAGVTGLYDPSTGGLGRRTCSNGCGIPAHGHARRSSTPSGVVGEAHRPARRACRSPRIVGDQQASLVGQGCIRPGMAKITFGTGGMLDVCLGDVPPPAPHGRHVPDRGLATPAASPSLGLEAVMLSAGTKVEWLRDGLGIIADPAESAASGRPGATTPTAWCSCPRCSDWAHRYWDHGARGALLGVTRGTTRAHVVRAVLEGVAQRGADLVEAAEAATGHRITTLRIDGGMSRNPVFVQALADATRARRRGVRGAGGDRPRRRSARRRGDGRVAQLEDAVDAADDHGMAAVVAPGAVTDRDRFADARRRAAGWIPELSAIDL